MALENKLGITEAPALAREEERISKAKAVELFDKGFLTQWPVGTVDTLRRIHGHLFGEIYDLAGQIRTVDLAKGDFHFAPVMYLESALDFIDCLPQTTFDEIVEKYVEMNVAHPFENGNGRAMRIWLDGMLKVRLGQVVDWSLVDKEEYLLAMERSPIKDIEIKHLLGKALSDEFDSREVFMKGIDHSYYYEGYQEFTASEL